MDSSRTHHFPGRRRPASPVPGVASHRGHRDASRRDRRVAGRATGTRTCTICRSAVPVRHWPGGPLSSPPRHAPADPASNSTPTPNTSSNPGAIANATTGAASERATRCSPTLTRFSHKSGIRDEVAGRSSGSATPTAAPATIRSAGPAPADELRTFPATHFWTRSAAGGRTSMAFLPDHPFAERPTTRRLSEWRPSTPPLRSKRSTLSQSSSARQSDGGSRRPALERRGMTPAPKTCASCGRTMTWRASWASNWEEVRYCSDRCRRRKGRPVDADLEAAIRRLLAAAPRGATICPSEAARSVDPQGWRDLTESARAAARRLVASGEVEIMQGGKVVDPSRCKGPIRIRRSRP